LELHTVSDPLTGNLHFSSVLLTDGRSQLSGNCPDLIACALSNEMLGTIFLGRNHCVMPVSGTSVAVKQFDAAVFVTLIPDLDGL